MLPVYIFNLLLLWSIYTLIKYSEKIRAYIPTVEILHISHNRTLMNNSKNAESFWQEMKITREIPFAVGRKIGCFIPQILISEASARNWKRNSSRLREKSIINPDSNWSDVAGTDDEEHRMQYTPSAGCRPNSDDRAGTGNHSDGGHLADWRWPRGLTSGSAGSFGHLSWRVAWRITVH